MAVVIVGYDDNGPIYGDSATINSYQPMTAATAPDPTGGGTYGGNGGPTGIVIPSRNNPEYYSASYNAPPQPGQPGYTGIKLASNNNPAGQWDEQIKRAGAQFDTTVHPATVAGMGAVDQGLQYQAGALETQKAAGDARNASYAATLAKQRGNTSIANANGQNLVQQQGNAFGALNAQDWQNDVTHRNEMDSIVGGLQGYTPIGYDQEGLAAQRQAMGNFSNIYGGGLDYSAAQYASDPADVQRQMQSYNNLNAVGGGSLDYQASQAQAAYAQTVQAALSQYASNPGDVKQQQDAINKLKGSINGGEWYDSMKDANSKYKALTDPAITDKERFLMENFRQQSEGQMRSNREALNADLGARGIRSGASEQVGLGMYNQEVGNERVLNELGAGASAIDRSMQALQGYADTSAQGRGAELQAEGMYSDAARGLRQDNDNVGMFNTHEANTNSMFNAGETNATNRLNATNQTNVNVANAGFQNDAKANNQATRLAGYQSAAQQSNAIRNSNDNVGMFNTQQTNNAYANNQATRLAGAQGYSTAATNLRNSNETINMFNKDQEGVTTRFNTQVKMDASNAKQQGSLNTTGQIGGRISEQTSTALGENNQGWVRNTADNDREFTGADVAFDGETKFADRGFTYGGNIANSGPMKQNLALSEAGALRGGVQDFGDYIKFKTGDEDAKEAARIAQKNADEDGIKFTW